MYIMRDTDGVKGFFPSSTERAVIGTFTYDAQRMGAAPTVTATLMYSRCLDKEWTNNEYVEFGGERYYVKQTPSSSKNNTDQRYKHEITFVSEREILENVYFLDVVTSGTEEQYQDRYRSNSSKVHFYGDIQEFVARLNDSLIYSGLYDKATNEGYHVVIDEGITSETKDVSIEDKFIAEALQDIYNVYELAYYWVGKTCHVGYTENAITTPIEYGSDNALISVQKANANYRIINRITGMGGTTNIPWYYPNMNAEGNASYETENIEKSEVIKISLNEILKYNSSPYTTYTLLKVTNPDASANAGNLAPFYDTYNPTILGNREVSATSRKGEGEVRTYITMSFRLKVKAQKGDKLLFSFNESFLSFRKIEGNANVSLSWQKVTSSSFGGDNNLKTKIYIGTWSDYYKPNETDATGEYIEVSSTWTNYEYTFYTSGWFQIVITGTVYAIFPESDPINSWATIGMSLNPKSSITYQKSNNEQYFFSYGQDEDVAYGESGITLANIDNAPFIPSHFEFINGEWVAIEDEGEAPAIINITGREWITPSQNLMPSIYRESGGAERYYNAINNTYNDDNGGKYTFNNQYDETAPREGMTTFEDIIPTINGIKNSKGQLIGEIADIQFDTDDSDILKDDSDEYLHSYFYIKLRIFDGEGGFNLFEHALADDEAAIEMTSGNCAACRFVIGVDKYANANGTAYEFYNPVMTDDTGNLRKVNSSNADPYEGDYILPARDKDSYVSRQQDTSKYEVWIAVKKEIDTFGVIMPNASQGYRPSVGDTFVITGISLPENYIREAEKRLDAALIAYMKANNDFKFTFTVNLSRIFLANNEDFASKLNENARVRLRYNNEEHVLYVSNYTCKADNEILYEVTVELTDTLVVSQSSLAAQLDSVKAEILSSLQGMRGDVLAQGLKYFLRKDIPDTAQALITFLKGLQSTSKVYLGGGAEFGNFMSGFLGTGARIDDNGDGEMESLTVRRELIVPLLSYNRVDIKVGDKWRAPGGGVIASVDTEAKRCTLRLAEGEIGAVAEGDICMGIFHSEVSADNATEDYDDGKGNRKFAGFTTVYFTITGVEGERNEAFTYQLRPAEEGHWTGQAEPFEEMQFVCYGSFSNEARQTSVYETRTYTRMLWHQNTWEISKANIALQYGDLSNLSVFEMQMQGYSMYLNSVYFTGEITQVKPDGTPVRTANDRGAWEVGTDYDYYDRVSHGGCLWLCVAEGGTDTEPADGNAAWLKQVDKGSQGQKGEKGDTGADGTSPVMLGQWKTGTHVPYLGMVRMGGSTWCCTVAEGTDNPPLWTLTDASGSRLTDPEGYYLLTGEENTAEYQLVAEDGQKGDPGAQGLQGLQGEKGEQGIPGQDGKDGRTTYFHIKYSANADGSGMKETPDVYIGTYVDFNEADSTDPSDYTWARFQGLQGEQGTQGIPGVNGADGTTYYLHIKYSNDGGATFTGNAGEDSGAYIGVLTDTNVNDSTDPKAYKWSKIKGDKGDQGQKGDTGADGTSPVMLGQWKTGTHVPYLGLVRMGGSTWCCTVAEGTDNPPLWTLTDASGSRLTDPDGYYLLTGEENTAEYQLVAEDGQKGDPGDPGADGKGIKTVTNYYAVSASGTEAPTSWQTSPPATTETNRYLWHYSVTAYTDGTSTETPKAVICVHGAKGADGLNGCAIRDGEWAEGVEYRNDEGLETTGVRFLDVVLVRNDATATGWDAYQCLRTHTSSEADKPGSGADWQQKWSKFAANLGTIFTSLIIAKNAKIRFLQGNQITVEKPDGTVTAGMSGSQDGQKTRFWAGSATPDAAPFRVDEKGKLTATDAEVTGTVNASAGTIGGFAIGTTTLGAEDSDTDTTVYAGNAAKKIYTAMGATAMPTLSATTVGKFINEQNWGTAWYIHTPNYGVWISARGTRQDIALAFDGGCVQGFAMKTRIVTSSVTLSRTDYNIVTTNSAAITITLPRMEMYDDGHVLRFKFAGGGTVNIKVQSCVTIASTSGQYASAGRVSLPTLVYDDDSSLDAAGGAAYQITTVGKAMELVWVRDLNVTRGSTRYYGAWVQYKMPSSW